MNDHTDLLNYLVKKYELKSYLEIGVQNPKNNFDKIKAPFKRGIDPDPRAKADYCYTSDEYFNGLDLANSGVDHLSRDKFDLFFIDGLHHDYQAKKDFDNSLRYLSDNGFIVIHDTCPEKESVTDVPRKRGGRWLGDVYKFVMRLHGYDNIDYCTLDFDNGCTVVWKSPGKKGFKNEIQSLEPITWQTYQENKKLLCLTSWKNFVHLPPAYK